MEKIFQRQIGTIFLNMQTEWRFLLQLVDIYHQNENKNVAESKMISKDSEKKSCSRDKKKRHARQQQNVFTQSEPIYNLSYNICS